MFPTGVLVNSLSIILGGVLGAALSRRLSDSFKDSLSSVFGICALAMGISSVILVNNLPAVIFAVIMGTALGVVLRFGVLVENGARQMQKVMVKGMGTASCAHTGQLVTIIVLFCASGTGIYGSIDSGMIGDHTMLISKSILDFFTAMIFACQLGLSVPMIAIPQFVIFYALFLCGGLILPLTTPQMVGDFKAVGGILLLATGLRMLKLKELPTAEMIPAMIIAMPCSWIWTNWIVPLL